MHKQIFMNRGWWQRLDDERLQFEQLLSQYGFEPIMQDVDAVWEATWVASWPYVELHWVPENHQDDIRRKAIALVLALDEAGLGSTPHCGIVAEISQICDFTSKPQNIDIYGEPLKRPILNEHGRPGTRAWNEAGLFGIYQEYCRISGQTKAAISIDRAEGRSDWDRAPRALQFVTEALRVYRPDAKVRAVSDAMSTAMKEGPHFYPA